MTHNADESNLVPAKLRADRCTSGPKRGPEPAVAASRLILDPAEPLHLHAIFASSRPLEVDVGCGKGLFLLARAKAHPETNFIGIDRLITRLRKVDSKLARAALTNVRLLHSEASYAIEFLLPPETVRTMYIFFPDPWPKRRHHRRRLFTPSFVAAAYRALLRGGRIHAATDDADYFETIARVLGAHGRFAPVEPLELDREQWSNFETTFRNLNARIHRCSFEKR